MKNERQIIMKMETVMYATREQIWRKMVVNSEESKMRKCTEPTETNFKECGKCIYCSTRKDSLGCKEDSRKSAPASRPETQYERGIRSTL